MRSARAGASPSQEPQARLCPGELSILAQSVQTEAQLAQSAWGRPRHRLWGQDCRLPSLPGDPGSAPWGRGWLVSQQSGGWPRPLRLHCRLLGAAACGCLPVRRWRDRRLFVSQPPPGVSGGLRLLWGDGEQRAARGGGLEQPWTRGPAASRGLQDGAARGGAQEAGGPSQGALGQSRLPWGATGWEQPGHACLPQAEGLGSVSLPPWGHTTSLLWDLAPPWSLPVTSVSPTPPSKPRRLPCPPPGMLSVPVSGPLSVFLPSAPEAALACGHPSITGGPGRRGGDTPPWAGQDLPPVLCGPPQPFPARPHFPLEPSS
nr:uncharacterized protein LOC131278651 [Dasypus novemcinctus]